MDEKKQNVSQIDLLPIAKSVLKQLPRFWWLVLLLMVLGAAALGFRSYRNYTPEYVTSQTFAASTGIGGMTDISTSTSFYDAQLRSEILTTFSYIMSTEAMQERVKNDLQVDVIPGSVRVEGIGDTCYFKLIATASTEEMSQKLLTSVAENYPQVASVVVGSAELVQIEQPRTEHKQLKLSDIEIAAAEGAAAGLLLGILFLCLAAFRRKSVESVDDMKDVTKLSCCGVIPKIHLKKRRSDSAGLITLMNSRVEQQLEPSVTALRTKVLRAFHSRTEVGGRLLMVTSTCAGEGKTTVAVNLAISLAQSGKRVLLVDADLRNQSIRSRFTSLNFGAKNGLLEILHKPGTAISDCVVQAEGLPLWILAGAKTETAPLSLLSSKRMKDVLAELKNLAEIVVVDSPPAGLLADAAAIGRQMDDAIYVIRCGGAPAYQIHDVMHDLKRHHVPMIGYVLNGYASSSGSAAYGTYGSYGKGGQYGRYGKYGKYGSYSYYSSDKKKKKKTKAN